ncbi:MAG: hypothetical protein HQK91_02075 [Nitrospirae bacterium]|nr:hypothetical protein [Nitrospirota bacterium]MBF0540222.1 hypothetical protein [Nitrospirota bacterium]
MQKIIYILKQDPNATAQQLINEHKKTENVTVIDLRTDKDYDRIIDMVAGSDKVITW